MQHFDFNEALQAIQSGKLMYAEQNGQKHLVN